MSPPSKTDLSSPLALTLRRIVMPTTGLSLRSSLHSLHVASFGESGSSICSTLPVYTPLDSTMRTSDFSFPLASSIVFQTPAGVDCAEAASDAAASRQAVANARAGAVVMARLRSEQRGIEVHHRRGAGARGADQRRRLRQQLGEV